MSNRFNMPSQVCGGIPEQQLLAETMYGGFVMLVYYGKLRGENKNN